MTLAIRWCFCAAAVLALVPGDLSALEDVDKFVHADATVASGGATFRRADCNVDGKTDIADAVCALTYLFGGGKTTCADALDANDDGKVDIADPIALLSYLFAQGAPPRPPFSACGADPTPDALGCASFALCPGGTGDTYLVKLVNVSEIDVLSPLIAVVDSIDPQTVTVANADGTYEGRPYFSYAGLLAGGMLAAGEETGERTWSFATGGAAFTFKVRVLGEMSSGWLPMQEDVREGGTAPVRKVGALSLDGLSFSVETPGVSFVPSTDGKTAYLRLSAPTASRFGGSGAPQLPAFSQYVVLPRDAQVSVEVNEGKGITYPGILVWPNQYSPDDNEDSKPPEFVIDERLYGQDAFYPAQLASMTEFEFCGARMALVQVALARTNPVRRLCTLYPAVQVAVTFKDDGKDWSIGDYLAAGDLSSDTGRLLGVTALNYPVLERSPALLERDRVFSWFYDLLIISDRAYETQAEQLAEHKRARGIATRVHYTDVIGGTTGEIQTFIRGQHTFRRISYVILFGDAENIPPHYVTRHPTGQSPNRMGTDLYYATMGGAGDLVPDIAIGRLPVNSAVQAQLAVDKIIAYENSPPSGATHADFYTRTALAAYFQDNNDDTYADRGFAQTIEEIFGFFAGAGYAPERAYATNSVDPRYWNDGTAIPAHLRMPGFPWDGDAADISAMLNTGSFLLAHRDHGDSGGWSHPAYTTAHIAALANGDLLPVVFSINCQTGWFDRETDEEGAGTTGECFSEQFLLKSGGGAVGVFGASRNSPSWPNNDLLLGMLDCVWPDMIPGYPTAADAEAAALAGSRRLGWMLNYGKLRVLDQWPTELDATPNLDNIRVHQREFEIYNLLGDPTLRIRTRAPLWFTLHLDIFTAYLTEYRIEVPPALSGSVLALVQDGSVVAKTVAAKGAAVFTLAPGQTLQPGDETYITAEGEGHLPVREKVVFDPKSVPVCSLYCLEVPTDAAGPSAITRFEVLPDGDLAEKSILASDGADLAMTSPSGFTATRRHLFAGHNTSGEIEMFEFGAGGELRRIAAAPTKGGTPAYLAADEAGERLFAATADGLVETFLIGGAGLAPLEPTPLKEGTARDIATFSRLGRTFLYVGSQSNPPGILIYQVKGDALAPVGLVDLSNLGGSRSGAELEVAPKAARLYMRDLDAGVFAFSINPATGELAPIKGSPFAAGGFGSAMRMSRDTRFLYAAYSPVGSAAELIASFAVSDVTGALAKTGDVEAPRATLDLAADIAGRMLYAASRADDILVRYAVNPDNGTLKYAGTTTTGTKTIAPAALWAR